MSQTSPSRFADKVMVRMPDGMRAEIQRRAARERRSANAEIVLILERALSSATAATGEGFADTAPAAASDSAARQGGTTHPRS